MKILKFGAVWCKECLVMRPRWEEIESEIPELKSEYYDADESPDMIKRYKAEKIPVGATHPDHLFPGGVRLRVFGRAVVSEFRFPPGRSRCARAFT